MVVICLHCKWKEHALNLNGLIINTVGCFLLASQYSVHGASSPLTKVKCTRPDETLLCCHSEEKVKIIYHEFCFNLSQTALSSVAVRWLIIDETLYLCWESQLLLYPRNTVLDLPSHFSCFKDYHCCV